MFDAANEFEFWGRQAVDHALFAQLALEVPALKVAAGQLHDQMAQTYANRDRVAFLPLLQQSIDFKRQALAQQRAGEWIGWAFPSFIQHMIDEENFALARIQGQEFTPQALIDFWNGERAGETAVTAHLIDPSAPAATARAADASLKFARLTRSRQATPATIAAARALAAQVNQELLSWNPPAQPLSIISQEIRDHVAREGQRFVDTTNLLLRDVQIAPPPPGAVVAPPQPLRPIDIARALGRGRFGR